jgi:hypothetical protein
VQASIQRIGTAGVAAEVTGLAFMDAWDRLLRQLGEQTRRMGSRGALLDITGLVGTLGVPEREQLGRLFAHHLGHLSRLALFMQHERISRVAERSACAAGMRTRVFADRLEAQAWLAADLASPAPKPMQRSGGRTRAPHGP